MEWKKLVTRRHTVFRIDLLNRGSQVKIEELWGVKYDNQMFFFGNGESSWYCNKENINNLGKNIFKRLQSNPNFASEIARDTERICLKLPEETARIIGIDTKKLDNNEIAKKLQQYVDLHYEFCGYFDISNSIKDIGTQKVWNGILSILKIKGEEDNISIYVDKLLTPEKLPLTIQEQIDLKKIAMKIKRNKTNYKPLLKEHAKKYEWLSLYNPDEEELEFELFERRLKALLKSNREIAIGNMKDMSEKTISELEIKGDLLNLIRIMRQYVFLHTFRAEMLSKSYFLIKPLLKEIACRWETDLSTICALTPEEIINALEKNKIPDLEEAKKRKEMYLHLMKNGKVKIYSGEEAEKKFLKETKNLKDLKEMKEIRGIVVSKGSESSDLLRGRVRIVRISKDKSELNYVKQGEILVTTMTSSDFVIAIGKAKAVVTNEGGFCCHAAILCRELDKLCIVGTKIATEVLKDGDIIEIDVDKGIIRRIR